MAQTIPAVSIPCNITDEEREALRTVAKDMGYSTIASFVRACIMDKVETELQSVINHNRNRRPGKTHQLLEATS